jgi:hypothetical protein
VDVRALRRAVRARLAALRAWATWTPRRAGTLAGVCVALLVVSPLVTGLARSAADGRAGATAGPSTGGEPVATPPSVPQAGQASQAPVVTASPSGANDEEVPVTPAQQEAAATAARRFGELWLAGAFVPDRQRWAASLQALVDPSLLPFLEATPASAIPRTAVDAVVPRLVAPTYGAVRVTFVDGTGMDLEMSATGSTWRVAQYLPTAKS